MSTGIKNLIYTGIICLLSLCLCAAAASAGVPEDLWTHVIPSDDGILQKVSELPGGGYIAGGSYNGSPLLLSLDADGNELSRTILDDAGNATTVLYVEGTADNGYVVYTDSADLIKTDNKGALLWKYHVPRGQVASLDTTPDGGYVLAGGYIDAFVCKVAVDGTEVWNRTYAEKARTGTSMLRSIQQDPAGGYIAAGFIQPIISSDYKGTVLRLDENGTAIWFEQFAGDDSGAFTSVQPDADGGYIATQVSGGDEGSVPSLVRLDSSGNITWKKSFSGIAESFYYVIQTQDRGYLISADSPGKMLASGGFSLIKTDSTGSLLWNRPYENLLITSVEETSDGRILIAGIENVDGEVHRSLVSLSGTQTAIPTQKSPISGLPLIAGIAGALLLFRRWA